MSILPGSHTYLSTCTRSLRVYVCNKEIHTGHGLDQTIVSFTPMESTSLVLCILVCTLRQKIYIQYTHIYI